MTDRPRSHELLLAAAAAVLLTVLFTHPWRPNLRTAPTCFGEDEVARTIIDATLGISAIQWGGRNPTRFYEAPFLLPIPAPLASMDPRLTEGFWTIPLARSLPPAIAWGAYLWIALAATAWASYLAGRLVTRSPWGGAALAVIFAFCPYRAIYAYHSEVVFAPFLPLAIAMLILHGDRPDPRRGVMLGLVAALAAIEHLYVGLPLAAALGAALIVGKATGRLSLSQALLPLVVFVGAVGLMYGTVIIYYLRHHAALGIMRGLEEIDWNGADLGAWIGMAPDRYPALFPGFVALGLGLTGLHRLAKRSPQAIAFGVVAFLLSFGTMRLLLWRLEIDGIDWTTPYEFLYRHLAPLRGLRSAYRFGHLAQLVLAVAAATTVSRLAARGIAWRAGIALLIVLAFIEARLPMREVTIMPPRVEDPAYAWIAARPETGAVLDAPMELEEDIPNVARRAEALWAAMIHGRPTPNGSVSTTYPWHESIAMQLNRPRPGRAETILRALGVRFIVARDDATASAFRMIGLQTVFTSPGGFTVFAADSPLAVPRTPAALQERLFALEYDHLTALETGLSLRARATAPLRARTARLAHGTIEVENTGSRTWCGNASIFGQGPRGDVMLALRKIEGIGGGAEADPRSPRGRAFAMGGPLPVDVAPGETALVPIFGFAPRRPGIYRLEFDLVARGIGWFSPPDSPPITVMLEVGP